MDGLAKHFQMKPLNRLPDRFNYAEVYLTLDCNLGCGYCINKESGVEKREELTSQQWAEALNKIDFGDVAITLGGGEPTLHPGFFDLVDRLDNIDLLTNLQFDVDEFIDRVDPQKFSTSDIPFFHPIRASYHPSQMDKDDTLSRVKKLRDNGFNVGLFGVMHPHQINDNMEMSFLSQREGIPFYTKDFLGRIGTQMFGYFKYPEGVDGNPKDAECRTRELLIAPDGDIHRCHRDLYHNENPIGNVTQDFKLEGGGLDKFRPCNNYGNCNPCDVKAKTNKYLNNVECQVEIK